MKFNQSSRLSQGDAPRLLASLGVGFIYFGWSVHTLIAQRNHWTEFTLSPDLFLAEQQCKLYAVESTQHQAGPSLASCHFFSMRFNHQGSLVPVCLFRFHLGHDYVSSVVISRIKKGGKKISNLGPVLTLFQTKQVFYFMCQFGGHCVKFIKYVQTV